jgi:hypothetical protein
MLADTPAVVYTASRSDFFYAEFAANLKNRFFHIFLTHKFLPDAQIPSQIPSQIARAQ